MEKVDYHLDSYVGKSGSNSSWEIKYFCYVPFRIRWGALENQNMGRRLSRCNFYTLLDRPGQLLQGQIQLLLEAYAQNFPTWRSFKEIVGKKKFLSLTSGLRSVFCNDGFRPEFILQSLKPGLTWPVPGEEEEQTARRRKEQKNGENSVKRERELHFATVINKRLQRLHNQKEDEKITNTQKKAHAEYNNDGDY